MGGTGSALGNHFNLGAPGAIEIGGLAGGIHLKLLDAVLRRGDYARRGAGPVELARHTSGRVAGIAHGVYAHVAVHVVGVVTAIQREVVLVIKGAGNGAVSAHARLQRDESAGVTA